MKDVIYILDDNPSVRDALKWLVESVGLTAIGFDSVPDFLEAPKDAETGCIILDLRMPCMSGLEVLELLRRDGVQLPCIILSAHGDVDSAVRAMKAGAFDFIQKPYSDQSLVEVIQRAVNESAGQSEERLLRTELLERLGRLTQRERDVLVRLIEGRSSKEIAQALRLSPRTVDNHRGHILTKMDARSAVEIVRNLLIAEIDPREIWKPDREPPTQS